MGLSLTKNKMPRRPTSAAFLAHRSVGLHIWTVQSLLSSSSTNKFAIPHLFLFIIEVSSRPYPGSEGFVPIFASSGPVQEHQGLCLCPEDLNPSTCMHAEPLHLWTRFLYLYMSRVPVPIGLLSTSWSFCLLDISTSRSWCLQSCLWLPSAHCLVCSQHGWHCLPGPMWLTSAQVTYSDHVPFTRFSSA